MNYYIKTFGCQQNEADSQRLKTYLSQNGYKAAPSMDNADYVVINTCMIRKSAENRVYGLVNNLQKRKSPPKIVITGCMAGMAVKDKSGKYLHKLQKIFSPAVEFLPIEEIGFDIKPQREDASIAYVPISSGCNNYCSFCVVPYTRGIEKSRSFDDLLNEIKNLAENGYQKIMLLGMNVNSYGSDLLQKTQNGYQLKGGRIVKPVLVKHLGKTRVPSLFPYLLEDVAKISGIHFIDFMSSNPWDFSHKLINIIAKNPKITKRLHLAVQSGSNSVLKRMNRWYTKKEYLDLIAKIRKKIPNVAISTDIIVGFCGETEKDFADTVDLCQKAKFSKAYISIYSDRPNTYAHKNLKDDVPFAIKKRRWKILEEIINKPNVLKSKTKNYE